MKHLQLKMLAVAIVLLIVAMLLDGCRYAVVESDPVQIGCAAGVEEVI